MQYSRKKREEARRLYLTGEAPSVAEIARRLKIKPHTVGLWKRDEDWDGLRLKMEKRAAEQLVEKLASERVTLNETHHRLWGLVVSQLFDSMQKDKTPTVVTLKEISGILEKAQKGQRLARGLSLDGQTEEQIQAEATAASRQVVDVFLEAVKTEVTDPETRERIARAVLSAVPHEDDERGE
jgi:transposase